MKLHDKLIITTDDGREVEAVAVLTSTDGRAGAIEFDALIGNWAGGMAVMQNDDGTWTALDGTKIGLRAAPPDVGG